MTSVLTQRHRAQQLLLRRATTAQVERLWPALDFTALDESFPALAVRLAALVKTNRETSAGVAAQYLRALRKAEGVRGDVRIVIPDALPVEQFTTSLRVTSLVAVKSAVGRGVLAPQAMSDALTQTSGAMGRLVLNAGRETVRATSIADPQARGWRRVGHGECDWCKQYLDGEVHMVEGYDFDAHDGCGCTAEPVYG